MTVDIGAVDEGGELLLPVRFMAESFGYNVAWHQDRQHVQVARSGRFPPLQSDPRGCVCTPGVLSPCGGYGDLQSMCDSLKPIRICKEWSFSSMANAAGTRVRPRG